MVAAFQRGSRGGWRASLALLGLVAGLSGCAARVVERPWLPGETAVEPAREGEFRARVLGVAHEVETFRALYRTTARRGGDAQSFRQAVVFEQPRALRIEALPPQGAVSLHLLVAQAGRVTVVVPSEKRAFRGPSSTAFFRQHLDLPFREEEIIALVSGRVELAAFDQPGEMRCGDDGCTIRRRDGRYLWRFDRVTGQLRTVSIRDPLKLTERVRVTYAAYEPSGTLQLPQRILVELPPDGISIEMEATMLTANKPIKSSVFEVAVPTDYLVSE